MPNIMLVDVDRAFLRGLKRALEEDGFEHVDAFTSTDKALQAASKKRYAVIIADFHTPNKNALEVLKTLRALQPDAVRIMKGGGANGRFFANSALTNSRESTIHSLSRMIHAALPTLERAGV